MPNERPNILVIMADQLPARCVGTYGHPVVKTPNMDRLAEKGLLFAHAYANCPICAPSRASFCTGQLVGEIDAFDNGADFPASTPTFMHHLRNEGYEVVLSGKMHFLGPDQLHGFERRLTPEIYPSGFDWTPDWNTSPCANPGTAVDQLKYSGVCAWSLQLDYDEEVHFRSLEYLREAARNRDRPFFLCASYTHPHDPFIITQPWWDLYDGVEIDRPEVGPRAMGDMHPYDQWLQIHHMVDVYPPSDEDVRRSRRAFYGMVSYFDNRVGELVTELDRLGLAENTLVVVTSDHGEMLGEHGMWFKRTYFEPSIRVPLIVAGPTVAQTGSRVDRTVSLVDLYPTFLELGGVLEPDKRQAGLAGESLVGLMRGEARAKAWAISEYFSEGVCQPMRLIVKWPYKYTYVHGEKPLLFDLGADPGERENRIDDPDLEGPLDELRAILHQDWDPEALRERVLRSQTNRRLIHQTLAKENRTAWDVQPHFDAKEQYVRKENAQVTNEKRRIVRGGGG